MTFSQKIKEELCRIEYDLDQKKAILSAFFKNNNHLEISGDGMYVDIKSKSSLIIRFILKTIDDVYGHNNLVTYERKRSENDNKLFRIYFSKGFDIVIKELYLNENPWKWLVNKKIRSNYLIGLFLQGGSINNPLSSNYHFELKIHNRKILNVIEKIFNNINIHLFTLERNKTLIVYIKKSESISDILKLMNATESMFEYEEKRISRDYTNQMSRLNNLDISNLKKTIEASHDQIKNIEHIKKNGFYNNLNEKEKIYCDLRLKYKQSSLNDLVYFFKTEHNIDISRGGINHIVRKLKKIIE